ncbi:MAG: hypothetical protein JW883_00365 [Deltaproteobacteria bacterium]|nr:hypothetical protein [Deltaproteobacteria bacterium]
MAKITIHLNESEAKLKKLIKDLQTSGPETNPYFKRSESEIAKMILDPALSKAHKKYVAAGQ